MSEISFRVENATFIKISGHWSINGRAYTDVRVGDALSISPNLDWIFRVDEIESYGRKTDLLSRMMTGTLIVSCADANQLFQAGSFLYRQDNH